MTKTDAEIIIETRHAAGVAAALEELDALFTELRQKEPT